MRKNANFSVVVFTLKSLFITFWVALFTFPAFWHLSTSDNMFRRYHHWHNINRAVEDKIYPFADLLHILTYPVHNAALKGKLERVAKLNPDQDSLNNLDWFAMTPLAYAAWNGEREPLLAFLDAGADPNVILYSGKTALMLAVEGRDEKSALILIKAGARSDLPNNEGITSLHLCIKNKLEQAFMNALTLETNLNIKDSKGLTPLDYAIRSNSFEAVTALAIAGADHDFSLTPKDIKTGIFLAQWRKTGDPRQAVDFAAEATGINGHSNYDMPAEFPVDLPSENKQQSGGSQ